jgi:hypothetical protein
LGIRAWIIDERFDGTRPLLITMMIDRLSRYIVLLSVLCSGLARLIALLWTNIVVY